MTDSTIFIHELDHYKRWPLLPREIKVRDRLINKLLPMKFLLYGTHYNLQIAAGEIARNIDLERILRMVAVSGYVLANLH